MNKIENYAPHLTRVEQTLLGIYHILSLDSDQILEKLLREGVNEEQWNKLNEIHSVLRGSIKSELEYLLRRECSSDELLTLAKIIIPRLYLYDNEEVH